MLRTAVPSTGPLCGLCSSTASVRIAAARRSTTRCELDPPDLSIPKASLPCNVPPAIGVVTRLLSEAGSSVSVQRQPQQRVLAAQHTALGDRGAVPRPGGDVPDNEDRGNGLG